MRFPAILVLAAALLLAGCGNVSRNRPEIVSTFPPDGAVLDNIVEAVTVTYDAPVTILNRLDCSAQDALGLVGVIAEDDPDDPRSIVLRPTPGRPFLPGPLAIRIGAGLVVNQEGQYRLENRSLLFELGPGPNLYIASGGLKAVTEVDPDTFLPLSETPTPGARLPIGVAASQIGADVRVWTQLADGDGAGRALAWYRPGDAGMTEVQLTVSPAGDLVSTAPTIAITRDGDWVVAAYRDTALERVRLSRLNIRTGLEEGSIVLSPPASPGTFPLGLRRAPLSNTVYVAVETDFGAQIVQVRVEELEEIDLGPGDDVEGVDLPEGAGQLTAWNTFAFVAPWGQTTANLTAVEPLTGVRVESESNQVGSPRDVLITFDGAWLVESLAGFADDEAMAIRRRSLIGGAEPFVVSSDSGFGNPPATAFRELVHYRTRLRFLGLFDNDVLVTFRWTAQELQQEDLNELVDGIQGVDLSAIAPDPLGAAFASGAFPP